MRLYSQRTTSRTDVAFAIISLRGEFRGRLGSRCGLAFGHHLRALTELGMPSWNLSSR